MPVLVIRQLRLVLSLNDKGINKPSYCCACPVYSSVLFRIAEKDLSMATTRENKGSQFYSLGSEEVYDVVCQPCQLDGKLQEAVGLCTDCQDYLCQRCFDVHTLPIPMRNHKLFDKKQMVQQQVSLKKEDMCSEKCAVHEDEVIKYYCIDHCQLGCNDCITLDHRSCDNVRYIPHAVRDLDNNEEYKQAENQLKSAMKRSKKITEESKPKTESTDKTRSDSVKMMQQFRKEMNEALDKIEADMVDKCETLKLEELEKRTQIVEKFKTAQRDLEELQTMKETYQSNKQNCSLYIAMMKAKHKLTLAEESLTDAEKEQSSVNSQITFGPNKETLKTLRQPESFGKLSKSGASSVVPEQTRTTVRQLEPPTAVNKSEPKTNVRQTEAQTALKRSETRPIVRAQHVQDINIKSRKDKKTCNITGLVVLPDNKLLVSDCATFVHGNGNVKLVDIKKGEVINHLTLTSAPWNVAMVTNSQVAVTLPQDEKVAMVNVEATAMTVDKRLDVDGPCYGVDYRDGKLAVMFFNPDKVQVLTLEGRVLYIIAMDKRWQCLDSFNIPKYVVFGSETTSLYMSNCDNSVVHVKLDGTVVGRYTDMELRGPRGLLTDSSGNIYICGDSSNNIHQITPDCRKIQVLLTGDDSLDRPVSISYSEAEGRLFVGMMRKNVIKEYNMTLSSK